MGSKEKMVIEYIDPKELQVNDYSRKLFPALQGEAYDLLKADIEENGIRTPLEVTKANLILCGHERHRVSLELGLKEVPIVRFGNGSETSDIDEKLHLIQDNLARKAVDDRTKARCAIEMDKLHGLKRGELGQKQTRNESGKFEPNQSVDGFGNEFLTSKQIAEKTNVTESLLYRAKKIEQSNLPEEIKVASFDGRLARRATAELVDKPEPIREIVIKKVLEKLPLDEPIFVEKITDEVTQDYETEKALENVGVPSVGKQIEQFYNKLSAPLTKVNMPKPTDKTIIQAILKMIDANGLCCSVCGEKHLKWKCNHEFQ